MKYFVFRNMTVERYFQHLEASFSGYEDVSFIAQDADKYVWFYTMPIKADKDLVVNQLNNYIETFKWIVAEISKTKTIIAFSIINLFEIKSVTSNHSIQIAINNYNNELKEIAKMNNNIKFIEIQDFFDKYPQNQWIDWKYFFISQMALNPKLAIDFQTWFSKKMDAIELKRKKCLILDLDNTLWGGIVGEDGINGIAIGGDYPGNAFLLFQQLIEKLGEQGIILSVCSKNNLTDIVQMWNEHPTNILKEKHFSALKINWNNKAENIRELADELNIGLDSMIFFDDNPSERELIKSVLPQVFVPDFPEYPYQLPNFIKEIAENYFSVYTLTIEDIAKTEQYKANAQRNNFISSFQNMDDYLANLEMILEIKEINDSTLSRVVQLIQKTNQFNLTTKRYTDVEILNFLELGYQIYTLNVKDKFGDNGLTGVIIIQVNNTSAFIDTLLLSCRILGKGIEKAFVYKILQLLKKQGIEKVLAKYIPSPKNLQVADFYNTLGFDEQKEDVNKIYTISLNSMDLPIAPYYNFN